MFEAVDDRQRELARRWVTRSVTYFGVLLAVSVVAFKIPALAEINDHSLYVPRVLVLEVLGMIVGAAGVVLSGLAGIALGALGLFRRGEGEIRRF